MSLVEYLVGREEGREHVHVYALAIHMYNVGDGCC